MRARGLRVRRAIIIIIIIIIIITIIKCTISIISSNGSILSIMSALGRLDVPPPAIRCFSCRRGGRRAEATRAGYRPRTRANIFGILSFVSVILRTVLLHFARFGTMLVVLVRFR